MNADIPLVLIDYFLILILLPIFAIRALHWVFDRHIVKDSRGCELVDGFTKRFHREVSLVEIRPGRTVAVLNLRPQSRPSKGLVIFVHGACARMQQLESLITHLSESGYETISYDALGCGASAKPVGDDFYTTQEMYADLVTLARKYTSERGVPASCIIGHSFGASMVTKLARTAESIELCRAAVSICQPVGSSKNSNTLGIFKLPISILWIIRPLLGRKARDLLFGPKATADLRRQEKEASARNPVHMFRSFYNHIDRKFLNDGSQLQVPVLFIGGEHDKICPAEEIKELAAGFKTNSKFVLATDCGHQCMQEDPEQIIKAIEKFLG